MFWTRCCAIPSLAAFSVCLCAVPVRSEEKARSPSTESKAEALVLQALDNEVAGDRERRQRLLEQALAIDSQYPPANWHLGNVRVGKEWLPVFTATSAADSELSRQYEAKRDEAGGSAALELKLAKWCIKNEMPDRARLHFRRVLSNPKASSGQVEDAAKQLDLVSVGGMILTRDQLKQEQAREKRIADAIERYRPILAQLQPLVDAGFDAKHDAAAERLAKIDDPDVIPAIETYLHDHQEGFGEELTKLLTKFPQVEATQTLVRFAVVSPFLSVRERAITELKKRPLHDYVPTLLAGLVAPIQSQYQFQRDARGNIRYQQVYVQERADATLVRHVDQLYRPQFVVVGGSGLKAGRIDEPGVVKAAKINAHLNYLIQADIANEIARHEFLTNAAKLAANQNNRPVIDVLSKITGQQLPPSAPAWWSWWQDYNQVHYPKQTYRLYAASVQPYLAEAIGVSCFVKGTVVWTEHGPRAIESIQPGDRILSQDPDTGELCFKLVTGTTVRPPAEASQLTVNGEAITTTLGHPLWVAGKGWEMAKHVQAGDQLHGIRGIVNVNAIEPLANKVEAHNLVVDDFNTYFVGNCGMLVHDNTYRQPTRAIVPGLVP